MFERLYPGRLMTSGNLNNFFFWMYSIEFLVLIWKITNETKSQWIQISRNRPWVLYIFWCTAGTPNLKPNVLREFLLCGQACQLAWLCGGLLKVVFLWKKNVPKSVYQMHLSIQPSGVLQKNIQPHIFSISMNSLAKTVKMTKNQPKRFIQSISRW